MPSPSGSIEQCDPHSFRPTLFRSQDKAWVAHARIVWALLATTADSCVPQPEKVVLEVQLGPGCNNVSKLLHSRYGQTHMELTTLKFESFAAVCAGATMMGVVKGA